MKSLLEQVARHKAGAPVGVYSVCSAHPAVLEAALRLAAHTGQLAVIEATSNQVNQDGGYTGMRPAAFRDLVFGLAAEAGLPREQIVLGGDHLGPNAWQRQDAGGALSKAGVMVAEYVTAGFRKIHLDCSMSCADDPQRLSDALIAERTAQLCILTEAAWVRAGGEPPVYIIGSEVPVPGGAHETLTALAVTTPEAAQATLEAHRMAFERAHLQAAWQRVVGLVVQPGVEFDHHQVIDYRREPARALSGSIEPVPGVVFEAHSTDYQTPAALRALVEDHFAILKVGPGVTFALREALWALSDIATDLNVPGPSLKNTMLDLLKRNPQHWQGYYTDPARLEIDLQYSLSDRIRYYWATREAAQACAQLLDRLTAVGIPLPLLSQYLPQQYAAVRDGTLAGGPRALLLDSVAQVLRHYAAAVPAHGRDGTPYLTAKDSMNLLGMTPAELESSGGAWTAREIAQQPDVWSEIGRLMEAQAPALREFLDPLLRTPGLRIVLTGAGTSAFIGEILAPRLTRAGRHVDAIATTDLVSSPQSRLPPGAPLLLVSFARSGNSPESVAAVELVEQAVPGCHHLVVTCNGDGALYRRAQEHARSHAILLPPATHDRGYAMTSSFSGMLLAAGIAFGLLDDAALAAITRAGAAVLQTGLPLVQQLAHAGYERVVYLGSNECKALAREAALKLLELADGRIVALSESPLGFRHGPKTVVNRKTLVVLFLSSDAYTRRYERDLLAELRADGVAARVIALTADDADRDERDTLAVGPAATDLALCLPYAVFAQMLALLQSLALGLRADLPNATGVVSRVVQGFKIHPWTPPA